MVIFSVLRPLAAKARFYCVFAVLIASLSLLTGCKKPAVSDPNDPAFIVASVGQWTVTRADLNKQVDEALSEQNVTRAQVPPAQLPAIESQMLRFIVLKKMLLDKAATLKLPDIDKEVADAVDNAKNGNPSHVLSDDELSTLLKSHGTTLDQWKQKLHEMATMQAVLDAGAAQNVEPTDQEIDTIYNAHKDAFNVPPMIRASRVIILSNESDTPAQKAAAKKAIDAAHSRVVKGEDFAKVATEVSQDRSTAPKGGDMGKFQRNENEPGFDDHVFNQKVNTVGPVFQTSLGYQFVKVTDSTPAGVIPLAEARALIAPKLRQEKKRMAENAYALNVLKDPSVNFYLKLIEPTAQGGAPGAAGDAGGPPPQAGADQSSAPAPDQSAPPAADQSAPPSASDTSAPAPAQDTGLPAPTLSATNNTPPPSM